MAERSVTVPGPAPAPRVHRGDVVGEIEIPRLHLAVMIFEGDDSGILKQGAGAFPGRRFQAAATSELQHIAIPTRPLRLVRANDVITLKLRPARQNTRSRGLRSNPTAIGVLAPAPGRDLTLVTCYPFFYIGSAPERFIVHARKIG